jgi:hypothetical protein
VNQPDSRAEQIRARRRIVARVGALVIVAASATACIFDQSDYKGGGRLDKGATAQAPTASTSASGSGTSPTSDPLDASTTD